jgi:hypothetical protein
MAKSASVVTLNAALVRERRANRRLRVVLEELRKQVQANRRDLDLQFTRLAQIQAELDELKRLPR